MPTTITIDLNIKFFFRADCQTECIILQITFFHFFFFLNKSRFLYVLQKEFAIDQKSNSLWIVHLVTYVFFVFFNTLKFLIRFVE